MTTHKSDHLKSPLNIFLDNQKFSELQSALVSFQVICGSYETYTTKIAPQQQNEWKHIILFPGTALKYPNFTNSQNTAKSLLSIFQLKNIAAKIYPISHRLDPIFPEATSDTLEILELIIKKNQLKSVYLLTWSAGCCHLEPALELLEKFNCKVEKAVMVSPVVEMDNKEREKTNDFLNENFFEFIQTVYCGGDTAKIQQLSLSNSIKNPEKNRGLLNTPISIVYGSREYIKKDIEDFVDQANEKKKQLGKSQVDVRCFEGQDHRLFCFLTTKETRANPLSLKKMAQTKWAVSKCVVDFLAQNSISLQKKLQKLRINPESVL